MPEAVGKEIRAGQSVMEFTNTFLNGRRLIRSQKNPMDKCTIVSIYPKDIIEVKHTIEPGHFHITPGTYDEPAVLVVGSSSWWKDIDVDQPMLEIPVSSIQIAESVIKDYCNGMLGCDMAELKPGLFFALGPYTSKEIKEKFKTELDLAKARQDNWYKILVRLADSLWARSNGNPLVICDDMRLAARSLNFHDKVWLRDFQIIEKVPCIYCGGLKDPAYPICPSCKAIDKTHPLAAEIKFAIPT
jgi:hypothetical protein